MKKLNSALFALSVFVLLGTYSEVAFAMPSKARCEALLSLAPSRRSLIEKTFEVINNKVKVAFFDADDTLRASKTGKFIVADADDVKILENVAERIKELNAQGYLVVIVSNQAGIGKQTTYEAADLAMRETVMSIRDQGAIIHHYDFAENKDNYRKPGTGMAEEVLATLKREIGDTVEIDWDHSFMVGDAAYTKDDIRPDGTPGNNFSNSDRLFAENVKAQFKSKGFKFIEAGEFFQREEKSRFQKRTKKTGSAKQPFTKEMKANIVKYVRDNAGDIYDGALFPEIDGGNLGLRAYLVDAKSAVIWLDIVNHFYGRRNPSVLKEGERMLAFLDTSDDSSVHLWGYDPKANSFRKLGHELTLPDTLGAGEAEFLALLARHGIKLDEEYYGGQATYLLLKNGKEFYLGTEKEGIRRDWSIDAYDKS